MGGGNTIKSLEETANVCTLLLVRTWTSCGSASSAEDPRVGELAFGSDTTLLDSSRHIRHKENHGKILGKYQNIRPGSSPKSCVHRIQKAPVALATMFAKRQHLRCHSHRRKRMMPWRKRFRFLVTASPLLVTWALGPLTMFDALCIFESAKALCKCVQSGRFNMIQLQYPVGCVPTRPSPVLETISCILQVGCGQLPFIVRGKGAWSLRCHGQLGSAVISGWVKSTWVILGHWCLHDVWSCSSLRASRLTQEPCAGNAPSAKISSDP